MAYIRVETARPDHKIATPVTLKNSLPVHVTVISERPSSGSVARICELKPGGSVETDPGILRTGDLLHFKHTGSAGDSYFVAPSIAVRTHLGTITVGSVVAARNGYRRDIHPDGDVSSVKIHNMLAWPVFVSYNGRVVAHIEANQSLGTKRHGDMTIAPRIYFDNNNRGIKMGDKFVLTIDNSSDRAIPSDLYSFTMSDRNASELFVGRGSTAIGVLTRPETHSYNLGGQHVPTAHNFHKSRYRMATEYKF